MKNGDELPAGMAGWIKATGFAGGPQGGGGCPYFVHRRSQWL